MLKKFFLGVGVRSQESGVRSFRLCCPCFLYQAMYYKKDNARFLKVPTIIQQTLINKFRISGN
ncbi:MAG: hypothetical protein EWV91_00135 [Microcystis aeruginosa Ma_QC_Ca_00000000_S207]|uniref:Uncharacterized protein n=1 Tax=Microcystis aeruginosa Ma_QC_Ca_00000000_S207 TaxID=2486251 RepID=A0A552G5X6_MICAE|nr:MAG: hypothetical protein EWV91_00135 [Microcystis aeruginosa Ma_QC_Ca_00000000_S207]